MKKVILIVLAIAALAFVGLKLAKPFLVGKAFDKRLAANLGVDRTANLEDGLHVYICGAGSPLPDPKRSGPCIGVLAGKTAIVFDAGTGGSRNLGPMGFPLGQTDTVFMTHLHSDHIDGLGEMLMQIWINSGRSTPVMVSGPIGTKQVVDGFNAAYQIDAGYRTAHHGEAIANPSGAGGTASEIDLSGKSQIVYDKNSVKITAFKVSHEPISPAFGYRIDYKGRAVAISGDTSFDPNVAAAAKDVDVLFHEALNMEMVSAMRDGAAVNGNQRLAKIFGDILDYHTSPVDAAKTAKAANAKALVLYHIVPMLPSDALVPMFVKGADAEFDGNITVSEDGTIVRLPTGGDAVIYEQGL